MGFLSVPGILLALFYMLVGTGLIVFEWAVILHLIDKGQRQESLSIREACRQSVFSLKGIRNLQLPLCTLYYALFLPRCPSGLYQCADSAAACTRLCHRRITADSRRPDARRCFLDLSVWCRHFSDLWCRC